MDVEEEDFNQMTPSTSNDSLMEVEEEVSEVSTQPATFQRYPILDQEWKEGVPQRVSASFVRMVSLPEWYPHTKL